MSADSPNGRSFAAIPVPSEYIAMDVLPGSILAGVAVLSESEVDGLVASLAMGTVKSSERQEGGGVAVIFKKTPLMFSNKNSLRAVMLSSMMTYLGSLGFALDSSTMAPSGISSLTFRRILPTFLADGTKS